MREVGNLEGEKVKSGILGEAGNFCLLESSYLTSNDVSLGHGQTLAAHLRPVIAQEQA